MLSTMRKYEISCTIILQSLAQIKAKYDKIYEVLIGNCDTMIFLGSSENETCKYVSEKLGKATIRTIDSSMSKGGGSGSSSTSFKKQARDLLDPAEVSKIDNKYCLVMIRGLNPFYVKKYPWEKHPNYGLTGDADGTRIIDGDYLEEHFLCRSKITNKDDEFLASETRQSNVTNKKMTPSGKSGLGTPPVPVVDKESAINAFNLSEGKSYQEQGKAFHSASAEDIGTTDVQLPEEKTSKYGKRTATGKGKKKEKPDYAAPASNAEGSVAGGMKMPKNATASGGGSGGGLQQIVDIAMSDDSSDAREKGERGYQTPDEPVTEEKRASGNVDAAKNMAASLGSGLGATSKPGKEKAEPAPNPFEIPFGDPEGLPFGDAPSIDSDDGPSDDSPESMDFVW